MKINVWVPIAEASYVRHGTVAILRMENGREYRATWKEVGLATAWYLDAGQQRKRPIGLFEPAEIKVLALGHSFDDGSANGRAREKERKGNAA